MKIINIVVLLLAFFIMQDIPYGKYTYKVSHFSESIEIKENQKFIYQANFNFSQYEVHGYYHILDGKLILNSHPQKDRLLVIEANKGKSQNITFEIKTKQQKLFYYDLHLILNNNQEIVVKEQWEKSKFKKLKIKGFYIIDKNGLKSPKYMIIGPKSNYFQILFETSRVFENERWLIKNNSIIPCGFDGELQNYFLKKNNVSNAPD